MSRYVSWTNVFSVFVIVGVFAFLSWGPAEEDLHLPAMLLVGFLTAFTASDMISRYMSIKNKEDVDSKWFR